MIKIQMGGCRCSYKNCKSATKTSDNLHFFHYPVKYNERCRKWIENACKPNFFDLAEDQLRNKVVCELHFETRCFTNTQRKRLLGDAIPTLDAGCSEQDEPTCFQTQRVMENVQILPANADGTLFTVDTDSLQQVPESQKVESYIYRNGALLPIFKNEAEPHDSMIYTISSSELDNYQTTQPHLRNRNGNEIFFEETNQTDCEQRPGEFNIVYNAFATAINNQKETQMVEAGRSNGNFEGRVQRSSRSIQSKKERLEKNDMKSVVRLVTQQNRNITGMKKFLKLVAMQRPICYQNKNRTMILESLRAHVPPTLFSLVNLSVRKEVSGITEEEIDFFKTIYSASSLLYDTFRNKYGWNLPDPKQFEECEVTNSK